MEEEIPDIDAEERLKNLPLKTENSAFAPDEMITCPKCARRIPPTRAECLYCGAQLEISDAQSKSLKPNLRPLEAWEKGFNLIFTGAPENLDDAQIERAAALLKIDESVLRQIAERKKPLPLARVAARIEAEIIAENLFETANVETKIVADEDLNTTVFPRRLRGMEFSGDKLFLILFSGDEAFETAFDDLVLIVTGAIFERRISGVEARVKGGESKLLEANETASDALLIDIYTRGDANGFRIEQQGFDFSCLGAAKSLLVAKNLRALVKELGNRAPEAKIVEDYLQVRALLAAVWSVEERIDSRGLKRDRFAKFNRENLTTISNAAQFTKYSRLQNEILKNEN